jgi:hypothetical protein
MSEMTFSDNLQDALDNLEKARKSLRKTSRISSIDIENMRTLLVQTNLAKKDMIAIMAIQGKVALVAEQFAMTNGRVYQLKTEYLKGQDEK